MDQAERLIDLEQRFGVSQEKIAPGQQVGIEMLNDPAFGGQIEIDQDIAAEDDVNALLEHHLAVIAQVHPLKTHPRLEQIIDLKVLISNILKYFRTLPCGKFRSAYSP